LPERLRNILSVLGERLIDEIGAEASPRSLSDLSDLKRETSATVATLAALFDFHGITPKAQRGTSGCSCRGEGRAEMNPRPPAVACRSPAPLPLGNISRLNPVSYPDGKACFCRMSESHGSGDHAPTVGGVEGKRAGLDRPRQFASCCFVW
jgi:hypothetical protein